MKYNFFIITFLTCVFSSAQVSTMRINNFKLGSDKVDIENIIGKFLPLVMKNDFASESINVFYNNMFYEMVFCKDNYNNVLLCSIRSKDKSLKTLSGIKLGATLDELLKAYKNNEIEIKYSLDSNGKRIQSERLFKLFDYDNKSCLELKLINEAVVDFRIRLFNDYPILGL